jgi:hypothetical protein
MGARSLILAAAIAVAGWFIWQLAEPETPAPAVETAAPPSPPPAAIRRADFGWESGVSPDARQIADWIVDAGDNRGLPFVILDKRGARVFVFHPDGTLRAASPALLGAARGDRLTPELIAKEVKDLRPQDRITPAGRFEAEAGKNYYGEDIVWVYYDAAISLHAVRLNNPAERRAERLRTPTPADNRISFGCINVPRGFFKSVVQPTFAASKGIVYVLPELQPSQQVFGSYDVDERARQHQASAAEAA